MRLFPNRFAAYTQGTPLRRPSCNCLVPNYEGGKWAWPELRLHTEAQDTESDAWKRLLDLIEQAASDQREEFAPGFEMHWEHWMQIVTLPSTIAKLKSVKRLMLYSATWSAYRPRSGK